MTTKNYGPWIKWGGGERPVPADTRVEVKLCSGRVTGPGRASDYKWTRSVNISYRRSDIAHYRIVTEQPDLEAAEKLLLAHGHTVTVTAPREHANLDARNAAVIWLYQRAADQACINARYPEHVARYPGWVKSQQTIANLAEELETSPQAWADFDKWCRGGGV